MPNKKHRFRIEVKARSFRLLLDLDRRKWRAGVLGLAFVAGVALAVAFVVLAASGRVGVPWW